MSNWKNAERCLANALKKVGIPAYRKSRGNDYSKSDFDVEIVGAENFKHDSKYTKAAPFKHHGLMRIIQNKYCKTGARVDDPTIPLADTPVLFTKNHREHDGYVTVRLDDYAVLVKAYLDSIGFDYEANWKILLKSEE